jgi:hypothetical protein
MSQSLLSRFVGVPIALVAMWLLFVIDAGHVTGRRRSRLVRSSAAVVIAVLFCLIVTRFVRYA